MTDEQKQIVSELRQFSHKLYDWYYASMVMGLPTAEFKRRMAMAADMIESLAAQNDGLAALNKDLRKTIAGMQDDYREVRRNL